MRSTSTRRLYPPLPADSRVLPRPTPGRTGMFQPEGAEQSAPFLRTSRWAGTKSTESCSSPTRKGDPMKALRDAALLLCIAFATAADEGTRFRAGLVGTQEVPAIFAAGSAIFEARVLDNPTRIVFELTYEQLTAPPLFAHVHFGQRSVNGGVSFFLC